ncbi:MAG: polysaccharide deacetylase family protein [Acidimicrobiales bacterium]
MLLYHTVSEKDWRFATDPVAFADHLDALVADGRRLCTIADLVAAPLDAGPGLAVTFDDGYRDNLDVALPLLAERGIPATIFVTTSYIDGTAPAPGRMLSPDGVRELHSAGIEVGSHGRRHLSHLRLSRAEIRDEMRSSRAWLEDVVGAEVVSFAYPHGHHDRRGREEVVAAGYRSASIVMNAVARPERDPFAISRLTVERHHDRDDVAAMLQQRPAGPRVRLRARAGSLRRAIGAARSRGHS